MEETYLFINSLFNCPIIKLFNKNEKLLINQKKTSEGCNIIDNNKYHEYYQQ